MNVSYQSLILIFLTVFLLQSCDESVEETETTPTSIGEEVIVVEPEEEVYVDVDDQTELKKLEAISEIRDSYQQIEERIRNAEKHISGMDANFQETYSANINWLNTTMRYVNDRKAVLVRSEDEGFDNIKKDIDEHLYQVEEHLNQLESTIY